MKRWLVVIMSVLSLVVLLTGGCSPAEVTAPATSDAPATDTSTPDTGTDTTTPATDTGTGTIEVHVTDAPPDDDVTSIMVTVGEVKIHKAVAEQEQEHQGTENATQTQEQEQQQEQQGEGEWISIEITGANPFDLVELKEGGLEELLASENVTAGKYTQIRMTVDNIEVSLGESDLVEATLPSGELKFVRPFDIVEGETTVLLLDFDADKSVTVTGGGKIIVKPVVKLAITSPASALSLEITSPEDGAELSESPVTINGSVSDSEAMVTVNEEEVEVAEDGSFTAQVELTEGDNIIEAVAVLDGQESNDSITVTYSPE